MKHFYFSLLLALYQPVFAQSTNSATPAPADTTGSISCEPERIRLRFHSYETSQLNGTLALQMDVATPAEPTSFEVVSVTSSAPQLVQPVPNTTASQSLTAGQTTTTDIQVSYAPAQLPYYPVRISTTLSVGSAAGASTITRDCYVYFTPYGSAEVWDIEDYGRLRRSWLVGNEATAPARLSVVRGAIPVSNIGPTEEAGPQDYIGMRFVEGLAYAVPMRFSSPTNSENGTPTDPQARDGCGGLGQRRYRGRIENVRVFTMHDRDGGGRVPIALKNARVRIMRSVDAGPDITVKQLYTDDQGFITEYGSRTVEFDHCSINTDKIQIYLSVELIDSPEKVRIKRAWAWYSWTRIETGRQQLSYNGSTRQTLDFGSAAGGTREISLDPNDAGRTFTWVKWSKQLLQQELGASADLNTTLAIKIETSGRSAYYDRGTRNIHFRTDRLGSERTAMHEFGHFAMHEMQQGNWQRETGGIHYLTRNNKHPNTTITEGFANGFAYIMDEMTFSVLDQESGFDVGNSGAYHERRRTQLYPGSALDGRDLVLNHPFVSEDILARTMLDLWDGPSNYARFSNLTPDDFTDGGADNFEMSLSDLFRPIYTNLISDPVRFYNSLLLQNSGSNANRNAQMRDIWHFNFSATNYNLADFTILGTDEISGSRVITHDRDDYELFNTEKFDKVETYTYQYIGTDVSELTSAGNSYNVTTYVQDDYDTSGRYVSSVTKNANGVTLSDPLQIRGVAELGLHSGAQPRWYNQPSGLTRYTKRTEHLEIALRAQARFTVGNESRITIGSVSPYQTASVSLYDGTYIVVEDGATLTIAAGSILNLWEGATLLVRNGGNVVVDGDLMIRLGSYLCIEQGGNVRASASSLLYVDGSARMGIPAGLGLPTNLACANLIAACGRVEIFNGGVTNIGGRSEALQFDGNDVVTIPNTNSYVNELGQQFGIEAYIRADNLNAPDAQTIFSSRKFSSTGTGTYNGILFTIYGGRLLLQLDGRNYFSDGTLLPNDNGCHHVAVTRDHTNRVRFYIDSFESWYSPNTALSAFSDAPLNLGADNLYGAHGEHFQGMIGELRVWNQWRSGEQIKQAFTQRPAAPQNGLVASYDMQDAAGLQSLSDLSGVGQTGRNAVPGVLGASSGAGLDDPTWVSNCAVACTVQGNFRTGPLTWTAPDSAATRPARPPKPEPKAINALTVSPNPATSTATLHFDLLRAGNVRVWVQDLLGTERALVLKETALAAGTQHLQLPIQKLPAGLYLVVVQSRGAREHIRLEVQ